MSKKKFDKFKKMLEAGEIAFPKLHPYQEQFLKMMDGKQKLCLMGGHHSGKTQLAQMMEQIEKIREEADKVMGLPKCYFIPRGLTNSILLNLEIFDRAMKDGFKLNLITGKYYVP